MSNHISGPHGTVSTGGSIDRLRELLNQAANIPTIERRTWLSRNVSDPEERRALVALLLAYDGDGIIDFSGR